MKNQFRMKFIIELGVLAITILFGGVLLGLIHRYVQDFVIQDALSLFAVLGSYVFNQYALMYIESKLDIDLADDFINQKK